MQTQKVQIRLTRGLRIGDDDLTAGAIVWVDPEHAAELMQTRRARLVDMADLPLVFRRRRPSPACTQLFTR